LQVSEYPDFRWVISSNFHKLISRTNHRGTESYALRHVGLLNPDQEYYWRVRARSLEGVWGHWSDVFSFRANAPAVPVQAEAEYDSGKSSALLTWMAGEGGTEPVSYRIYGSNERGFTPKEEPYTYDAGLAGSKEAPANLLFETNGSETTWKIPQTLWRPYYRIASVDSEGRLSGTSSMVELTHPLIITSSLLKAQAGSFYQSQIEVSASIGHLVSQTENGKAYQLRFRNGDRLSYTITGAPRELSISRNDGLISGYLSTASAGKYRVSVKVIDERTGNQDERSFELVVQK
jgi:hypothetical protein